MTKSRQEIEGETERARGKERSCLGGNQTNRERKREREGFKYYPENGGDELLHQVPSCFLTKLTKISVKFRDGICAHPNFVSSGNACARLNATRLGSVHLPGNARRTHMRRSRHLPFYDPKVEGQQVTRV
ncbi:hypothetical protein CRG98_025462 [Punica granatum]|uniref:Uncharacterized protein n=1 Tax=Punica granatum TaxID=22663 RepID=A0A2I0JEQ3_PUNGR|nr:hypothetical protein CRG98_025462 [Punica granatum]